jgi:hypothetical protein
MDGNATVWQLQGLRIAIVIGTACGWLANEDRRGVCLEIINDIFAGGKCLAFDNGEQVTMFIELILT